jgi:Uma2 family endonuclease
LHRVEEFVIPHRAVHSPDASQLKRDRWDVLTQEQKEEFAPVCPDFVVELRSDTNCLKRLQNKKREYRDKGSRLGWLIVLKICKYKFIAPVKTLKDWYILLVDEKKMFFQNLY